MLVRRKQKMNKKEGPEKREKYNLGVTLEKSIQDLSRLEPRDVCLNSSVIFNREKESYVVPYLNRKYLVHHETGEVTNLEDNQKPPIHMQIIILHYLATADGTPLSGEWITFKELPGGAIYVEPYQGRNIKPLLKHFGQNPRLFQELALTMEGKAESFGDVSVVLRPFPKIPLGFVFWEGDHEFSPSATIIYDSSAPHYLPTEDYALLPGLIIWELAAKKPK